MSSLTLFEDLLSNMRRGGKKSQHSIGITLFSTTCTATYSLWCHTECCVITKVMLKSLIKEKLVHESQSISDSFPRIWSPSEICCRSTEPQTKRNVEMREEEGGRGVRREIRFGNKNNKKQSRTKIKYRMASKEMKLKSCIWRGRWSNGAAELMQLVPGIWITTCPGDTKELIIHAIHGRK